MNCAGAAHGVVSSTTLPALRAFPGLETISAVWISCVSLRAEVATRRGLDASDVQEAQDLLGSTQLRLADPRNPFHFNSIEGERIDVITA